MADWCVEALDRTHERAEFACGKDLLDRFIRNLVTQYEKRRLGRTYVAVRVNEKRVLGYFTLASGAIAFENVPDLASRKLPRHPVPVILLARLAVDQATQGQGLGRFLLRDALQRCQLIANQLGVHAVEVHAIDEEARAFYAKYGFVSLQDNPLHLFLPMATIEDAFGGGQ